MKTLIKACLLSLLLMIPAAFAADLSAAKQQGWIGEQNNGYLGLVRGDAPADVKALLANVNAQRKAEVHADCQEERDRRGGSGQDLRSRSRDADFAG
jgi:uncharacterized protein YdbL (DUF1318 family)